MLVIGLGLLDSFEPFDRALWGFIGDGMPMPPQNGTAEELALLLMAFGGAWVTIDIARIELKIVVVSVAFLQVLSLTWVLNLHQVFFPPFAPALAGVLSFGLGSLYSLSKSGGRKRRFQLMFGERVSKKSFNSLVNSNISLDFEGQTIEVSVLVCEIFNHLELMDALPPADYVTINNLFLSTGADFLVENGACLDECDGERLRVIFGAPLPDPDHAATACEAALELARRLEAVSRECEMKWRKGFDFRIGINSGEAVAAACGSRQLGAYRVSGDPVASALRLCAANRVYGSRILIGSGTLNLAPKAVEVRPLELIHTRDARTLEEIYELIGMQNALSTDELGRRDSFWKGVIYYREQLLDEALDCFSAAINPGQDSDPPLELYIRRIEKRRAEIPDASLEMVKF